MAIVEVGGTVGDIESLPFLEAIRQMGLDEGPEQRLLHPPDAAALHRRRPGELKTKPTQHSVKELRGSASSPTSCCAAPTARSRTTSGEDRAVLLQRAARRSSNAPRRRFDLQDPGHVHDQMLDEIVCHKLGILAKAPTSRSGTKLVATLKHPSTR